LQRKAHTMKRLSAPLLLALGIACQGSPENKNAPVPEPAVPAATPGISQNSAAKTAAPGTTRQGSMGEKAAQAPSAAPGDLVDYVKREQPKPRLASPEADVLGFRLGMSPAEVLAAAKAKVSDARFSAKVHEVTANGTIQSRSIFDGTTIEAPSEHRFVEEITFNNFPSQFEILYIKLLLPPEPNVVGWIRRSGVHAGATVANPSRTEEFVTALKDKYGKDPATNTDPQRDYERLSLKWLLPGAGKGDCLPFAMGMAAASTIWSSPQNYAAAVQKYGVSLPAPEECAVTLVAVLRVATAGALTGFVQNSEITLSNPGDPFINKQRHETWKAQANKAAIEKYQQGLKTSKPAL
jgi:hypothetical protein